MRSHFFAIAALVGASALTVNAQQPTEQQRPQQQRPNNPNRPADQQQRPTDTTRTGDTTQRDQQQANTQTLTLTGCVKAGKDVAGRTANRSQGTASGETFVLTNAQMAKGSTTSGIGLATSYELAGLAAADLQKHLNHQVEVIGQLTTGNAKGNRGRAPASNPGAERREGTPQAANNADLAQFQVTSIKMLSTTCTVQ